MQSADRNVLTASQSRPDNACHSPSTAFSTDMDQAFQATPRAGRGSADLYSLARQSCAQEVGMPTRRSRRRHARETSPSPFSPPWTPRVAQYGTGIHHNVAVPMSDGVELRVDIHYPTAPGTERPAAGPFPVLMSMTPYGKKAPPPAAQIGGGPTPYLIMRGYIEVMVDVRGPPDAGRHRIGRLGIQAAQRQRAGRHVRGVLPGDQSVVHRCSCRAEFAAEGHLPGNGRTRLLPRRGGDGRRAAPAHGAGLRRGLPAA